MSDRVVYTKEAARAGADAIAASIADSTAETPVVGKLRFFDNSLVVDEDTTRQMLVDAETQLVGYPAGGFDLTDFDSPKNAPLGGAVITSNLNVIEYASGGAMMIGGYWVEDATTPTPRVRYAVNYDPPRTLASIGQGWPVVVQMGYGGNVLVPAG